MEGNERPPPPEDLCMRKTIFHSPLGKLAVFWLLFVRKSSLFVSSVRWWNIGFKPLALLVSLLVVFSMINKTVVKTFLKVNITKNHDFTDFFLKRFPNRRALLTQVEMDFLKHMFFAFTSENSCFGITKCIKKMLSTWTWFSSWSRGGSLVPFHMTSSVPPLFLADLA